MNTALRHWKEAATLVVAAGRQAGVTGRRQADHGAIGPATGPHWPRSDEFDYEILVVKRSQGSSFMPSASVFPGGMVDSSDFHHDWAQLLAPWRKPPVPGVTGGGIGVAADYGVACGAGPRPPAFASDRAALGSAIPGELAFRICAIRETFEESGVLIARPAVETHAAGGAEAMSSAVRDSPTLRRWRERVRGDARLFAAMCRDLRVVPDVWALHEWSNWVTPVPGPTPVRGPAPAPASRSVVARRFDTVFFLCCLDEAPAASHDDHETVSAQWVCPPELLSQAEAGAVWLAPPQRYEAARLSRVASLPALAAFARRRSALGLRRWMPVVRPDPEAPGAGLIAVLPGDELYPAKVDVAGDNGDGGDGGDGIHGDGIHGDGDVGPAALLPGATRRLHRSVTVRGSSVLLLTVVPECGHLAPFVRRHGDDGDDAAAEEKTEGPGPGVESRL